MKSNKWIVLIIISLFLIFPLTTLSIVKGDVDGDGKVNSMDYVLVRKHILKQTSLTGDKLKRADANNDGKVNSMDYITIRKIIINGENATPTPKQDIHVEKVELDKSSLSIAQGEKETLKATIYPSNATNKNVTWSSSNTEIATVDKNGVVTLKNLGTAKITVTTKDGNKQASCDVSLKTSELTNIVDINPTKICSINVNASKDIRVSQGMYFYRSNGKDYVVYAGYSGDNNHTTLTLVDLNDCSIITKNNDISMGHANDMTYNSDDKKFYVVSESTAKPHVVYSFSIENNKEIIVDPQPKEIKYGMSGIAYDKDKKQYYRKAGYLLGTISSLDGTFTKIRNVPTYYSNIDNGTIKTVDQVIDYAKIDGHRNIFYGRTISNNKSENYNNNYISAYDADTGKYKYTLHFAGKDGKTLPSGHLEGITIIDDTVYVGLNIHYSSPKQVIFYKYSGLTEMEKKYK